MKTQRKTNRLGVALFFLPRRAGFACSFFTDGTVKSRVLLFDAYSISLDFLLLFAVPSPTVRTASALDIVGKGLVDRLAVILSVVMMLRYTSGLKRRYSKW
ncbi:MAG: hypothetical protein LBB51_04235 [Zoogloeaceae bacterium]|jgi:hypothetical protein|nr:hypothetical protein [Zoogloeaceae bacterium]